ncbi:MAG TPA: hypothetical protein VKV32_16300 [Stellaceae bacterium]|nr:hypothetical protein [Stellaceae bacterium]
MIDGRFIFLFLGTALASGLAGCSGPPALLNGSEQGVVVRYSQSSSNSADAVAAAEKFCSQYGRKAIQGDASMLTGDTYVSFSCQKP